MLDGKRVRERLKRSRLFRFAARRLLRVLRPYVRLQHAPGRRTLWHSLVWRLMWTEGRLRARTCYGAKLEVDASDIVGSYIAYFGVWEPNLTHWLQRRLRPEDVFVDVGANIGYFTLLASHLVGTRGGVVAIEPSPQANAALRRNVAGNGAENVRVEDVAVWKSSGEVVVFGASDRIVGGTTLDPAWADRWSFDTQVAVSAEPLWGLLSDDEASRAAVLKVDVEGSELEALEGMQPLLPRLREDVAIVIELEGDAVRIARDVLGRFGFEAFVIENDYSADSYLSPRLTAPRPLASGAVSHGWQVDLIFARPDVRPV
jgi:FkbM family methyltransferase